MNLRLQKLRKLLGEKKLDAVLLSSLANIAYLTNFSDFSTEDRDAFLLITKTKQYIFTHGIYKEAVEKNVKNFTLIQILRENPISEAVKDIVEKEKLKKIGFESFDLTVNEFNKLVKQVPRKFFEETDIVDTIRVLKDSNEIQAIKDACALGDKAYSQILKKMRIGMTEKEVAFALEMYIKNQGADISFPPIVAYGANASKPHHVPTNEKLSKNNLVLVDFGVKLNNYCSDMTRTFFFGKTSERQKIIFQTVFDAQQNAVELIKNLLEKHQIVHTKEVDKAARDYIVSKNFPQFPHSLGHGIGLNVHEAPRLTPLSKETLEEGMVFSVEPGIYLPDECGIRIEDIFAIEKNKLVQLTNASRTLLEI